MRALKEAFACCFFTIFFVLTLQVTASLALSIISILGVTVAFFEFLKGILNMQYYHYRYYYSYYDDITNSTRVDVPWRKHHTGQLLSLEAVFMYQSLVGMVFLIMMTAFARAALRSSKTQAIVVMNNLPSAD
ncbi:unnamed protein product [Oncorhynchus mykiss]|uniref:Uncharacterized protein n=1 Tax=Oncorhynchus mykiss TaxID=8022 RepID=A0A060ZCC1_ONCMY|nr:unnamed protein product [Oncorhynchus mykiss]